MEKSFKQYLDATLKRLDAYNNPYFQSLREKTFDADDFTETQIQFYYAVVFFSRPMAALAGKIPTGPERLEIIRNVFEEHGEGDQTKFHAQTFKLFLEKLGVPATEVNKHILWPEVRTFNTVLTGACVMDDYLVGTALMGIIERMFAEISAWIGQGIIDNGWIREEDLIHYNLHAELDIKHSDDFFEVLAKPWSKGPEQQYLICQGLQMGGYVFDQLYRGLYTARKRRNFS